MSENILSKQNFGESSASKIVADSILKSNEISRKFASFGQRNEIAKSLAIQIKTGNDFQNYWSKSLVSQFASLKILEHKRSIFGASSYLEEISKNGRVIRESFAAVASSQVLLSNSLLEMSKTLAESHLNQFNSLNVALQGFSKSFLAELIRNRDWEEFDVVQETNETITLVTNDFVNNYSEVTHYDLENLKISIIEGLSPLLSKTKSEKTKNFVIELMALIGFILSLYSAYGTYQSSIDKSNVETYLLEKKEREIFNKEVYSIIDERFNDKKYKIARTKVDLKYSTKKNSKIVGKIKLGQKVTIIEIRGRYFLIMYLDKDTQEPKSGFVLKKYFDTERSTKLIAH